MAREADGKEIPPLSAESHNFAVGINMILNGVSVQYNDFKSCTLAAMRDTSVPTPWYVSAAPPAKLEEDAQRDDSSASLDNGAKSPPTISWVRREQHWKAVQWL